MGCTAGLGRRRIGQQIRRAAGYPLGRSVDVQRDAVALQGANWWLRARIFTDVEGDGLALVDVRNWLRHRCIDVEIDQARGLGPFRPLARLTVKAVLPSDDSTDTAFDPMLNVPPGVQLLPHWLATFRELAYRRSRHGREADQP